jgi:lauroyl/myristoyl acyltransferase
MAAFFIKSLMLSCRVVKIEGLERVNEAIAMSGRGAVFVTWHQRIFEDNLNAGSRWCDEQFGPESP